VLDVPQAQKSFWNHSMVLPDTRLKWELVSVLYKIVLLLTQDRCIVCVERTIGSKIILDTPMELLGDVRHVGSHFFPLGDSVSVSAR
jgi:hypothetical protein